MEGQMQLTHHLYSIILAANASNLNLGLPPFKKRSNRIGPEPRTEDRKPQNLKPQTLNLKP